MKKIYFDRNRQESTGIILFIEEHKQRNVFHFPPKKVFIDYLILHLSLNPVRLISVCAAILEKTIATEIFRPIYRINKKIAFFRYNRSYVVMTDESKISMIYQ